LYKDYLELICPLSKDHQKCPCNTLHLVADTYKAGTSLPEVLVGQVHHYQRFWWGRYIITRGSGGAGTSLPEVLVEK